MKMNKLVLLLACMLLLVSVCAGAGAAAEYTVIEPAGFDGSNMKYPVVYVMPEDGYTNSTENPLAKKLQEAMNSGDGMSMLLVMPSFDKNSTLTLREQLAELVNEIDNTAYKNKTVADPKFRAIVGSGIGGYMAYASMLDESGAVAANPELFAFVASTRGHFVQEGNPWYAQCGSIYDKLSKAGKGTVKNYYTYMDTPVDDEMANAEGSTNDLGHMFIRFMTGADAHEYTARPGSYTGEFLKESAKRMANRFTNYMVNGSFMPSLSSVVVTSADASKSVSYSVMALGGAYGGAFDRFLPGWGTSTEATVKVSVIDPDTGKVLTSKSDSGYLYTWGSMAGAMDLKNVTNGKTCEMKMTITIFGATFDVANANMVCIEDSVFDGEKQKIDLMGDWYFKYTGYQDEAAYLDVAALTESKEYRGWSVVQPALGNWDNGYGNINGDTVGADPNSGYFNMMILGNGYYARDFELPAKFTTQKPVISIGYVDDRCEVFVNGVRIGGTGFNADGSLVEDAGDTWSVYSCFEVDPSILNYGGENTIVVRAWNNTGMGAGGWYAGPVAIYSEEAFNDQGGAYTDRFYEETYYSDAIGQNMQYLIYLPQSYGKTDRYYPTMYLFHQFSSSHTSYMVDGVNALLDEAIADGLLDNMIVVIPNSDPNSWWKGKWENMVINDLIPHIDANYRTVQDARYRFTAGCSMGGQGAASIALTNPDLFSGFASFYGAFYGQYGGYFFSFGDSMGDVSPITVAKKEGAAYMDNFAMAFICGNQDSYGFGSGKIQLHQLLEDYGVEHHFLIDNGGHEGTFYLPRFKDTLSYVWKHMYDETELANQEPDLRKIANAQLLVTDDGVIPVFTVSDRIAEYYNQIPASSYTGNQTPALSIPLRITITQNGKTYQALLRDHTIAQGVSENMLDALTAEDFKVMSRSASGFDLAKEFTYTIEAAIFDNKWVKLNPVSGDLAGLPATGDDSSVVLFALLLAASVGVLGMLAIRKRRA